VLAVAAAVVCDCVDLLIHDFILLHTYTAVDQSEITWNPLIDGCTFRVYIAIYITLDFLGEFKKSKSG